MHTQEILQRLTTVSDISRIRHIFEPFPSKFGVVSDIQTTYQEIVRCRPQNVYDKRSTYTFLEELRQRTTYDTSLVYIEIPCLDDCEKVSHLLQELSCGVVVVMGNDDPIPTDIFSWGRTENEIFSNDIYLPRLKPYLLDDRGAWVRIRAEHYDTCLRFVNNRLFGQKFPPAYDFFREYEDELGRLAFSSLVQFPIDGRQNRSLEYDFLTTSKLTGSVVVTSPEDASFVLLGDRPYYDYYIGAILHDHSPQQRTAVVQLIGWIDRKSLILEQEAGTADRMPFSVLNCITSLKLHLQLV